MKELVLVLLSFMLFSCGDGNQKNSPDSQENNRISTSEASIAPVRTVVNEILDDWHQAGAEADFDAYFGKMSDSSIYIGTDATENWNLKAFKSFSKPYFDRGNAWDFTSLERNIYFSDSGEVAWFDELLDTHMGLTRGSGVLTKEEGVWKIKHYVLSLTIPNENLENVKAVNREFERGRTAEGAKTP